MPARPALATGPGAAGVEAPAMAGELVCVAGGANSAGQAALYLARSAARGHAARPGRVAGRQHVRLPHHAAAGDPGIGVGLRTRVAGGHGQASLEALALEGVRTGQGEPVPAAAVFVMTGAAHAMAPRPRRAGRAWIRPGRPRRSPRARMAAARSAPAVRDAPARAVKTLAARIRVIWSPRAGPGKAIACNLGPPGCAGDQGVPQVADAGSRSDPGFRNLRGSATGLSPG